MSRKGGREDSALLGFYGLAVYLAAGGGLPQGDEPRDTMGCSSPHPREEMSAEERERRRQGRREKRARRARNNSR